MRRFLLIAAVGVLALVVLGGTASAQKRGGRTHGSHVGRYAHGRTHALPRSLHGRALPGGYARFSRFRYDVRYRSRFYLAGNSWYYWYAPFQYYLPVEVIAIYPPTVGITTAVASAVDEPGTPAVGDPD
jgi:hypothetical protein